MEQRQYKAQLLEEGKEGIDLFEAMISRNLQHKVASKSHHRCPHCWHPTISKEIATSSKTMENSEQPSCQVSRQCICRQLEPLLMRKSETTMKIPSNVDLLILMNQKEYMSGGNSAKLLLQLLPDHCELFVFGKIAEVDRLFHRMVTNENDDNDEDDDPMRNTMILWPSPEACSVSEFLHRRSKNGGSVESNNHDSSSLRTGSSASQNQRLKVVVLDGTYTQARNMRKSLRKRIQKGQVPSVASSSGGRVCKNANEASFPTTTTKKITTRMPQDVMVRPETESIFHRAQKNYGHAHQQRAKSSTKIKDRDIKPTYDSLSSSMAIETISSPDIVPSPTRRVSTAEACGMLLVELGADISVRERIIEAVKINNQSLASARGR
jgi:DTW domain-containing protein YfiP